MDLTRRFRRLACGTFLVGLALVGIHAGEFWPFSTFPMFAYAGNPWTETLIRDVTDIDESQWTQPQVIGEPFALSSVHVHQDDLVKLVREFGDVLDPAEAELLSKQLSRRPKDRRLLLYLVRGALTEDGVQIAYQPAIALDSQGAYALVEKLR